MKLTLVGTQKWAVAIRRGDGRWYDWATEGWETPFVPATHLRPFTPPEAAIPALQAADLGDVLETHPDAVGVLFTLDPTSGAPTPVNLISHTAQPG